MNIYPKPPSEKVGYDHSKTFPANLRMAVVLPDNVNERLEQVEKDSDDTEKLAWLGVGDK